MKKFPLSFCLFLLTFTIVHAEVGFFAFTTRSQTVLPNTLSKEITVQTQNSNGVSEAITETFDLTFTSSSPTGLFLGSTGKSVSKTMSKGTANRTFYYKDSSVGDFVITVIATGRDSLRLFKVTQNIAVSSSTTKIIEIPPIIKSIPPQTPDIKSRSPQPATSPKIQANASEDLTTSANTTTTIVFTAPAQKGFVNRLFAWPIKFFDLIRRFFLEV